MFCIHVFVTSISQMTMWLFLWFRRSRLLVHPSVVLTALKYVHKHLMGTCHLHLLLNPLLHLSHLSLTVYQTVRIHRPPTYLTLTVPIKNMIALYLIKDYRVAHPRNQKHIVGLAVIQLLSLLKKPALLTILLT